MEEELRNVTNALEDNVAERVLEELDRTDGGGFDEERIRGIVRDEIAEALPAAVEEAVRDLFSEIADDLAAAASGTDTPRRRSRRERDPNTLDTDDLPIGSVSPFTDGEKRVLYALQRRCMSGNPEATYEEIREAAGGCGSGLVTNAVRKAEDNGWLERDTSGSGTVYEMHKRMPTEEFREVRDEVDGP